MRSLLNSIAVTLLAAGSIAAQAHTHNTLGSFAEASTPTYVAYGGIQTKWPILNVASNEVGKWPILSVASNDIGKWPVLEATGAVDSFATLGSSSFFLLPLVPALASLQSALLDFTTETNKLIAQLNDFNIAPSQATVPVTAPIPEPSTYAMMMAGLLGIGFVVSRRNKRR